MKVIAGLYSVYCCNNNLSVRNSCMDRVLVPQVQYLMTIIVDLINPLIYT